MKIKATRCQQPLKKTLKITCFWCDNFVLITLLQCISSGTDKLWKLQNLKARFNVEKWPAEAPPMYLELTHYPQRIHRLEEKNGEKISDIGPTPKIARISKIAPSRTSVKQPFFSFFFDSVTRYLSTTSVTRFVGKNSHFIVFLEFALFWSFQSKTNE